MPRYELVRPVQQQSFFARLMESVRSFRIGPLNIKDAEINKYFSSGSSATGLAVNEFTALNYSAVWAAVNLISGDVASLPLVLYRRRGTNTERYVDHPLYRMLHDSPNPEMTSKTFRQTLQAHTLTWGGGYAEIERDNGGRPKYVWPITPERVAPFHDGGVLRYRVTNTSGKVDIFDQTDMLHIPGLGWDGVTGYGVIAKAAESVGMGLAAEKFGATFYGNGSTFGGTIMHPTKFATPQARENFEKSLRNRNQGVSRAHNLLLLEDGMTYAQSGIPPDQAQFLESRQFQVTEIARWFNVPPHKIGDLSRATFSNIEQQNIEYFQTTLVHWLVTWEQELMRKLISPLERNQQFIEHVVEGLLRGDSQGRAALQTAEFQIGALTPDEARALSNRDPIAGGDRAFVPMNMIPLDKVDEWVDAQIEAQKAKANPPAPASDDARVAVLEAELRVEKELVALALTEVETWKEHNRGLSEALSVANTGLTEARELTNAERANRVKAEGEAEVLTEKVATAESRARDAEERLAIEEQRVIRLGLEVGAATSDLLAVTRERDAAIARVAESTETISGFSERIQSLGEQLQAETSRADSAEGALRLESESRVKEQGALTQAWADKAEAESAKAAAEVRATQAELEKGIAESAAGQANAVLQSMTDAAARRDAAVVAGHRELVVDALQRVVTKEADRARRHQATREKLRSWAEVFYPDHAETIAAALRPALVAIVAWRQSSADVDALAAQLAEAHCEESQQQLRAVLAVEDYAVQLERMLHRWDERRPAALADAVLREDLGYVQRG